MDIPISHTKRGRGICVCGESYPCRYKPERCPKCDAFLGGSFKPKSKKARASCPDTVQISTNLFSVKCSTRDDRCFAFTEGGLWICLHHECKALRSTYSASGKMSSFRCKHIDKINIAGKTSAQNVFNLTQGLIDTYVGGNSTKEALKNLLSAIPCSHPAVVCLTDSSYAVFGPPSATNTVGYCHIRVVSEEQRIYKCTSKNCRTFVSKAKQAKVRAICIHLHLLYCCIFNDSGPPLKEDLALEPSVQAAIEHSQSRQTSVDVALQRRIPYKIPVSTIITAMRLDAASFNGTEPDGGWPHEFVPDATACTLCDGPLSQPRLHPGQSIHNGAILLTELNAFKKVKVLVKFCANVSCKAMYQPFPIEIGLFNISDKLLVSVDILLELREHFKRGSPISNVIASKLEALKLKSANSDIRHGQMEYISELLYNGFFCFEAITKRDLDSVVCGICGACPEVLLGDGNEKNCCSNSQIRYHDQKPTEDRLNSEDFFQRLKRRWVERTLYTRTSEKFEIGPSQVPPLIAPSVMGDTLFNTEMDKSSVHLKSFSQPAGDPSMLHDRLASGSFDINTIRDLSHGTLTDICRECKIPHSGKSKERMIGDINSLYSSVLVGLCPCHGYSKLPGRTGGFYHLVCRHGCTFASKFLTLTESVRDAGDLYLSLKYPPTTFISDSPCGFARHLEFRDPEISRALWGDNRGCFEAPKLHRLPSQKLNFTEIIPSEYREEEVLLKDPGQLSLLEHPVSGSSRHFVLGDRFHSSSNPHKSPLCAYHNINLCEQANTISTSMQESENNRKNDKRLRSACQQTFEVHYMFNFLMDFYQNEAIVAKQKRLLEAELQPGESLKRNNYHRFVISDD